MTSKLAGWHNFTQTKNPADLMAILHEDAVFHSPVVHTPQRGKMMTAGYLIAAMDVLGSNNFTYAREFDCGDQAVLEFTCEIDGIHINGVDMITFDEDGKITDFKVMVRPLKAIDIVHRKMGEKLIELAKQMPPSA